ncbi:MAG: FIST C-terminal domain-containing protein, partial [Bacteroidetes bacterium]|nr:FIST C-terminal domain-containing protein [Bacteroidota bacterium]
ASAAAMHTLQQKQTKPDFALLISCVGRKLVLGNRTEEEVEAVAETYGEKTVLTGFYSYGELSPLNEGGACRLHNQTMTITSFYELP